MEDFPSVPATLKLGQYPLRDLEFDRDRDVRHSREGGKVHSRSKCNTWRAGSRADFPNSLRSAVEMTQRGKDPNRKLDFSTLLGNPAQNTGFPHSHSACYGYDFKGVRALCFPRSTLVTCSSHWYMKCCPCSVNLANPVRRQSVSNGLQSGFPLPRFRGGQALRE